MQIQTDSRYLRPDNDTYFLRMAKLIATRGTCRRRRVGCVLVDERHEVLATGRNGNPRGMQHCIDVPCAGADAPSGTSLELCEATHAEQNALLQCRDVNAIFTCYTTASPCVTCVKLLLNTNCQRIVFLEEYPHSESRRLWLSRHGQANEGWFHKTLPEDEQLPKRLLDAIYNDEIVGTYQHYKTLGKRVDQNDLYTVIAVAEDGDSHEKLVAYLPPKQYGAKLCVRPLHIFFEWVTVGYADEKPVRVKRFTRV